VERFEQTSKVINFSAIQRTEEIFLVRLLAFGITQVQDVYGDFLVAWGQVSVPSSHLDIRMTKQEGVAGMLRNAGRNRPEWWPD